MAQARRAHIRNTLLVKTESEPIWMKSGTV